MRDVRELQEDTVV